MMNLQEWITKDLVLSGLTPESFHIEPLTCEEELIERLGFSSIEDYTGNWLKIFDVGGYWITYLNAPGYYRLKLRLPIETENGKAKYLSPKREMGFGNKAYILPQVNKSLINYSPDKPIFITEGEKKAAKATLEGFPCIGLSGVWNFKDSESEFLPELDGYIWKNRVVYIVFDSDIVNKLNVKQAEIRLAIELINQGAKVLSIRIPNESNGDKNGLDDYLVRYGKEAFQVLIKKGKQTLEVHVENGTDAALIFKEMTHLCNEMIRAKVLKLLARRDGISMNAVEAEYRKYAPKKEVETKAVGEVFTDVEIAQAKELLNSPDILSRVTAFTKEQGFTGEDINQKLLYLSFSSRVTDISISTIVKGQSASGKSYLVKTIARLFPIADVLTFSYVTAKSLIYRQGDLSHKILCVAEHTGSEGADYSIRTLLSEGEISILTSVKNESTGNWEGAEIRIPAKGLVFVETTTRDRVHAENQTRVFDLYVDDSEGQTESILFSQAEQVEFTEGPETESKIKVWRAAQTLLHGYRVYIPYARELAQAFPKEKTRARRDFPRLLSLIRTHTLLHQLQRETDSEGRLIATVGDFEAILPLAETVLAQSMKELSPKQEQVLKTIQSDFKDVAFSVKELSEKVGKTPSYRTIQRYAEHFVTEGVLEWNGEKGAGSRYTLSIPVSSCRNSKIFTPNLLDTLKNNYDKTECRNMSQCRDSADDCVNNDKPRQKQNVVMDSNNDRGLDENKGITTITTECLERYIHPKNLREAGSTDPQDWEEETRNFLSGEAEGI